MTDSSDCESDAGASPSVSSDESSNNSSSSRCSSPVTKANNESNNIMSSRRRTVELRTPPPAMGSSPITDVVANSTVMSSAAGRKTVRKRQASASACPGSRAITSASQKIESQSQMSCSSCQSPQPTRKRKRTLKAVADIVMESKEKSDSKNVQDKKTRSKRRRTRSERNLLAGKTGTTPVKNQVVNEGEEAVVALDAEIDRVLEEKAIKNNLSATNVKSIIHHVITNNMVQKMIMSAVRKKAEAAEAGLSSDDDGLLEPKMTRAKMKELLENRNVSLWPMVDSPAKKKKPMSETQMLIQHDLPEDSSGDEEYVPKDNDFNETVHSDDENSSVASSVASDVGSPASIKQRVMTRRSLQAEAEKSFQNDLLFKTPPPRPRSRSSRRNQEESAISLRTRSKLPLTDTALEDLERQFVPPDVTNDMYDWGTETDNEDYLAFLKEFLNPALNDANEVDDDAADPEYNVMDDDEDLHDREELRRDRAVKVPKKELTQLIQELFEQASCDEFDDHDYDLSTLTGITPLIDDSGYSEDGRRAANTTTDGEFQNVSILSQDGQNISSTSIHVPSEINNNSGIRLANAEDVQLVQTTESPSTSANYVSHVINSTDTDHHIKKEIGGGEANRKEPIGKLNESSVSSTVIIEPLFRETDLRRLQQQMRQHIQLLAQSFVLTATSEDPDLKRISYEAKSLINNLKSIADSNGPKSVYLVCNLHSAWTLANHWPHNFFQRSPIKKKILEETYISESGISSDSKNKYGGNYFPRHVVKVILENPTFIYNDLLPLCFDLKNKQARCRFCFSEDALLVNALEDFKHIAEGRKYTSCANMAQVISELLLVVHPPKQIYHRIRNLRKVNIETYPASPEIKMYFTNGILPKVDQTSIELSEDDKLPIVQRNREQLPKLWKCLLQHYEALPMFKWDATLTKDPFTKSYSGNWNKRRKQSATEANEKDSFKSTACVKISKNASIDEVFPLGTLELVKPNPDMITFPLLGPNGKTGAIVSIPKYAFPQQPSEPPTLKIVEPPTLKIVEPPTLKIVEPPTLKIVEPPTLKLVEPPTLKLVGPPTTASTIRNFELQEQPSEGEEATYVSVKDKLEVQQGPSLREPSVNESSCNLGNVTPPEQLLKDEPYEFDDTKDGYVEAYLSKVQTTTEPNHPDLFPSFIELLNEIGEEPLNSELQILHRKVKHLFKDYPDLLEEFEIFLNAALPTVPENLVGDRSSTNAADVAEATLVETLWEYTKDVPQVRAKIISKCKSLKEANPGVTEKELARALEPFFIGNPVMMAAFKDVIPLAYQFLLVRSDDTDFEMVDRDMEESPKDKSR